MFETYIFIPVNYHQEQLKPFLEPGKIESVITEYGTHYVKIGNFDETIIYASGNNTSVLQMIPLAKEYSRMTRKNVIIFDYPGYGFLTGTPDHDSTSHALMTIMKDEEKYHLIGESIGTGVVLSYINRYGTNRILTVSLISPFTSLESIVYRSYLIEMLYSMVGTIFFDNYLNIQKIPNHIPVKIFSLKNDEVIGSDHGKRLHELCCHSEFIELENPTYSHGNFSHLVLQHI